MSNADVAGRPPSAPRRYRDLSVELRGYDPASGEYDITLLPSPEFGEPPVVRARLDAPELADDLDDLEDKRIDLAALIRLGEALADRLLPGGPIREHVVDAVRRAGQDDGVRLRLLIRDPRLAQLPWEYCYLPIRQGQRDRTQFLVLDPQISLVRHVPLDQPQPSLAPREPDELRLVAAFANPAGMDELTLRREWRVIEAALAGAEAAGVPIAIGTFLEDATPDGLAAALQQRADLFHFAGHGGFEERETGSRTGAPAGAGCIVLLRDAATRRPAFLAAPDLALHLQRAGVRVAVLGACESGRHDHLSPWAGVAPALVGRGGPAVVAMQYEIEDRAAVAFSQGLYTALAAGLSIDEAVYAGRLVVLGRSGEDDVEWGVPVLYLRSGDGVIFPGLAEQPSSATEQLRTVVRQNVRLVRAGGSVTGIDVEHLDTSLEALAGALGTIEIDQRAETVEGEMTGIRIGRITGERDRRET